jgi:hypothetical protein
MGTDSLEKVLETIVVSDDTTLAIKCGLEEKCESLQDIGKSPTASAATRCFRSAASTAGCTSPTRSRSPTSPPIDQYGLQARGP